VPGTTVLIGYSQDFVGQAKCATNAGNQIDAGSQIELNVAGACRSRSSGRSTG